MTTCRSCGAEIIFVVMPSGKRNPLDAHPSEKGNVKIENGNGVIVPPGSEHGLRLSHFSTCPNAKTFRKKDRKP
jgi:hypothetical protein